MRSTIKKRAESGFTLIEVMVALAVASGALVLILSANTASLRKSVQARVRERLERAAESKFAEWKAGAERVGDGMLVGFAGHRWEVRTSREELPPLRKLLRITFTVTGPSGPVLVWTELRDTVEAGP